MGPCRDVILLNAAAALSLEEAPWKMGWSWQYVLSIVVPPYNAWRLGSPRPIVSDMSVSKISQNRGEILDEIMRYHRQQLPKIKRQVPLSHLRA